MLPTPIETILSTSPSNDAFHQVCSRLMEASPAERVAWMPHLKPVLASWPAERRAAPEAWVRRLIAEQWTDPVWQLVGELRLTVGTQHRPLPEAVLSTLERSPYLKGVEILSLEFFTVSDVHQLARLARCTTFPSIRRFTLWGAYLQDHLLPALVDAPWMADLTELNLGWNQLEGEHLDALLCSPHLNPKLRELWLGNNRLGMVGIEALAKATRLAAIDDLTLYDNLICDEEIEVLASIPHLSSVRRLYLDSTGCTDGGARFLAASPHLRALTHLSLHNCNIGDGGVMALANAPITQGLVFLGLIGNRLSEETIRTIRQMPRFQHTLLKM